MEKKFFVYVMSSKIRKYIYVGLTENVEKRVGQHNSGKEKTTKPYTPFELIHQETFSTRLDARKREKQLKTGSGKEWIKKNLI
jgi:putative endonuclease